MPGQSKLEVLKSVFKRLHPALPERTVDAMRHADRYRHEMHEQPDVCIRGLYTQSRGLRLPGYLGIELCRISENSFTFHGVLTNGGVVSLLLQYPGHRHIDVARVLSDIAYGRHPKGMNSSWSDPSDNTLYTRNAGRAQLSIEMKSMTEELRLERIEQMNDILNNQVIMFGSDLREKALSTIGLSSHVSATAKSPQVLHKFAKRTHALSLNMAAMRFDDITWLSGGYIIDSLTEQASETLLNTELSHQRVGALLSCLEVGMLVDTKPEDEPILSAIQDRVMAASPERCESLSEARQVYLTGNIADLRNLARPRIEPNPYKIRHISDRKIA
jgi:hypothetical protein